MEIYRCLSARDGQQPWTAGGSDNIDDGWFKYVATGFDRLFFTSALLMKQQNDTCVCRSDTTLLRGNPCNRPVKKTEGES